VRSRPSHELFIESQRVALTIYCDENGLDLEEGRQLAWEVGQELENAADYRATYLNKEAK
jgi:hypothetical protein